MIVSRFKYTLIAIYVMYQVCIQTSVSNCVIQSDLV